LFTVEVKGFGARASQPSPDAEAESFTMSRATASLTLPQACEFRRFVDSLVAEFV
jgi:hypothetical protein